MAANPCISKVLFCSAVRSGGGGSKGLSCSGQLQSVLCFKVGLPRVLIVCVVRSRARIVD